LEGDRKETKKVEKIAKTKRGEPVVPGKTPAWVNKRSQALDHGGSNSTKGWLLKKVRLGEEKGGFYL